MFRYEDRECGESHDCATLEEALEAASESLTYYRKDAVETSEWSTGVEGVVVGCVENGDRVTPLFCATYVGNDEEGYDVQMLPVPEVSPTVAPAI
jgi:gamma-glutamylcysteine synthetase